MAKSKRPANLTTELLMNAMERQMFGLDNPGFCLACGNEQEGCEPDAHGYECEACGEHKVAAPGIILGVI